MPQGTADVPVHDVDRAVAMISEGVTLLAQARTWSKSQDEIREAVAEVTRLGRALLAVRLRLVRASAERDTGMALGHDTVHWMAARLGVPVGRARADVENATLLDPEDGTLRELGRALLEGKVSTEHVDVARQVLSRIPTDVLAKHRSDIAENLTENASRFPPRDMRKVADHLVSVLAPAREERLDPFAEDRRHIACYRDSTGMTHVSGQLSGEGGLFFKTVLDQLAAPHRGVQHDEAQTGVLPVADTRTPAQRTADALVEMARLAASHARAAGRGRQVPHLVIHTSPEQLAWVPDSGATPPGLATCEGGDALSPALLQRTACDAVLQVAVRDRRGAVIQLRTPRRLANRALRRALAVRDGGCAHPGCSAPPSWCDAHHIVWWSRGGATEMQNLVLLCPRHHTEIHLGEWRIEMRDRVPWFVPPRHLDPGRTPIRNTVHAAIAETTALAQQLWLDGDEPIPESGGTGPPEG